MSDHAYVFLLALTAIAIMAAAIFIDDSTVKALYLIDATLWFVVFQLERLIRSKS